MPAKQTKRTTKAAAKRTTKTIGKPAPAKRTTQSAKRTTKSAKKTTRAAKPVAKRTTKASRTAKRATTAVRSRVATRAAKPAPMASEAIAARVQPAIAAAPVEPPTWAPIGLETPPADCIEPAATGAEVQPTIPTEMEE